MWRNGIMDKGLYAFFLEVLLQLVALFAEYGEEVIYVAL